MDPNPKSFPVLSYVMARLPTFGPRNAAEYDIEQPDSSSSGQTQSRRNPGIVEQMPHLSDPKVISAMRKAIHDVYQTRSVLQTLGPRPDHETVDKTKARIIKIESDLAKALEDIVLSIRATDVDQFEWRVQLAEKEKDCREKAAKEKSTCKKILELDEMHEAYEKMLKGAEERLAKIYERAENGEEESEAVTPRVREEVNEEVVRLLQEAAGKSVERVDLSSRQLRFLPEAFGRVNGLRFMNLSNNQLEVIPDSIAGLMNLEELNLASNFLETLPDSIGLLYSLKFLDVSGNKLSVLPDSISHCKSLVELDATFNRLAYLPTNIGHELVNLQKLSVPLNKIRFLPSSIGEMASLRHLDAHFNELHGLPVTIGKLTNLEILDLSSNFTDMKELPETFGELTNLKELDLSNNQIHALPDTFGRLDNLTKLNLEENPLVVPPAEVVKEGVDAVKLFMGKRWVDILLEEERKSMLVRQGNDEEEQAPTDGWFTRSTSWLKTVSGALGAEDSPNNPCLNQQL